MRWFAIAMLVGCLRTEPREGELVVDRAWHLGGFGGLGVPPQLVRRGGRVLAAAGGWVYVEEPIDADISAVWRYPL